MIARRSVIFVGPTLEPVRELGGESFLRDAEFRPPAVRGDVYRAARERPWGIGLIDGQFERLPAVLHKELLWALSQGIHVYGAAGHGALRAVELERFGMVGVGSIFEAFRAGTLSNDDEIAVVHLDQNSGYRPLTDALVDMRATLERAERAQIVAGSDAATLIELAEKLHYRERSYGRLMAAALSKGLDPKLLARLEAWLPDRRVQLKRADGRLMLRVMADTQRTHPGPRRADFVFEHTDAFARAVQRAGAVKSERRY